MANRPPGSNTVAVSSGLSHNAGHKKMTIPAGYLALLDGIKQRIRAAQVRATLSTNAELIHLYWDIGRVIDQRQRQEGWGAGVIPRLAIDLLNELPAVKGFLQRNIKRMLAFYRAYPDAGPIVPQLAAQLPLPQDTTATSPVLPQPAAKSVDASPLLAVQRLAALIPWFHHVLLLEKVKDLSTRLRSSSLRAPVPL